MSSSLGTFFRPALHIEGHGPRTVVLIHGWPDTHRIWDATVSALRDEARCVRFTLPGFDPTEVHAGRRAMSLDDMMACLDDLVRQASPDAPVTLLLHDWGCFFGYQYAMRHKDRVERIVGVDIGDIGSRYHRSEMTARAAAITLGYQLWLALAWRLGGPLGDRMARWIARSFRAPAAPEAVTAAQGYPYAMAWFKVAGGFGRPRAFSPMVPMLFIHGERKPMRFHSANWAERIASRPGSRVIGMPTGHWVMAQAPDAFHAAVRQWLHDTDHLCQPQHASADRRASA
jgi:pimeloyl-ACP methyl ester carboxylesterase